LLDEQVRRAMEKWPQVPSVYGWLRLGRRGQWFLIDRSQADFDEARDGAGSLISSPPIIDFIGRNYECDERGAWYWQNGPQRAFVRLDLAPLILRVLNEPPRQRLVTHTGFIIERIEQVLSDGDGNLLMLTDLGPAALDDRDMGQLQLTAAGEDPDGPDALRLRLECYPAPAAADWPHAPEWRVQAVEASGAAASGERLGFVADPTPADPPAPAGQSQPQASSNANATSSLNKS
jgi:hypothetical protein